MRHITDIVLYDLPSGSVCPSVHLCTKSGQYLKKQAKTGEKASVFSQFLCIVTKYKFYMFSCPDMRHITDMMD